MTVDTVLVVLVGLLLVGLLRAYAEVLRRMSVLENSTYAGSNDGSSQTEQQLEQPTPRLSVHLPPIRSEGPPAVDIQGLTLQRGTTKIAVGNGTNTLLAFLSSGCVACKPFWAGLRSRESPLSIDSRVAVITKDPSYESTAKLVELAPPNALVVMSSKAWEDYKIEAAPYFIHVDGQHGRVTSEGSAGSWEQVDSLLRDAILEAEYSSAQARIASPGEVSEIG